MSPALAGRFSATAPPGKPVIIIDGALGGWVSPLCTGRTSGWGSFVAGLAGERGCLTASLKVGRLQWSLRSVGSNDPRGVGFDVSNKVKCASACAFLC